VMSQCGHSEHQKTSSDTTKNNTTKTTDDLTLAR